MSRGFLIAGALFGGVGVALGAFGAHGLQNLTNDEKILHAFRTGVEYQMYHGLALLVVSIIFAKLPATLVKWVGICFIAGIILFSGSLYAMTAIKISNVAGLDKIGIVTPVGGMFFILGWIFLLVAAIKKRM